jgi:hypothetical protein
MRSYDIREVPEIGGCGTPEGVAVYALNEENLGGI